MNIARQHILFVDDERFFARDYIKALSTCYDVQFCEDVDEAKSILCNTDQQFAATVVDLQMPSPLVIPDDEVVHFVDSGLWLLERAFPNIVARRMPVVILTNREFPTFRDRFERIGFPSKLVEVHVKFNTSCKKLVSVIKELVANSHSGVV